MWTVRQLSDAKAGPYGGTHAGVHTIADRKQGHTKLTLED